MAAFPKRYNLADDEDLPISEKLAKLYDRAAPPPVPEVPQSPASQAAQYSEQEDEDAPSYAEQPRMAPAPQKREGRNVLAQLKDYFVGGDPREPQYDSSGIEKPHAAKRGVLEGILNVGLPALYSMAQGEGLVPGALEGVAAQRIGDVEAYKNDLGRYNAESNRAATGDYHKMLNELKLQDMMRKALHGQAVVSERSKYHEGVLGNKEAYNEIARQNADTNKRRVDIYGNRPQKVSDTDRYIDIKNKLEGKQYVSPGQLEWFQRQHDILQKRGTPSTKGGSANPEALKKELKDLMGI